MGGWGKGITGTSAFNKSCFIACSPHGPSKDRPPPSGSQNSEVFTPPSPSARTLLV